MNDNESTPNPAARHAGNVTTDDINAEVLSQHDRLRAEIPTLLAEHAGKWALYLDGVQGFYDSELEAVHSGALSFGPNSGFTVDRVEADRTVYASGYAAMGGTIPEESPTRAELLWALREIARENGTPDAEPLNVSMVVLAAQLATAGCRAWTDGVPSPKATRTTPPTREEVQAHHDAEGGYWLVSRVDVGGSTATDWHPMVLRLRNDRYTRDYLHATIPGVDWGDYWSDDPFALMAGATWTRLSRDGAVMGGAK